MKNKIIVILVPVILSILLSLYFTLSGTPLIRAILTPLTACGLILGLVNLILGTVSKLMYVLLNILFGILIFSLLYFGNKEFFKEYILMGAVIGFITGVIGSLLKKTVSPIT
jgi:hypothetical protein